ncbi:MAG: hypothetical protein AB1502_00125 [Thermodesulfobacteriota bacterium]
MMKTRGNLLFSTEGVIQKYAQVEEDKHYTLKQKVMLTNTVRNIFNLTLSKW